MTKHTPATPLPFKAEFGEGYAHVVSGGQDIARIHRMYGENSAQRESDLAAYIAHAANAYPRLVAVIDRMAAALRANGAPNCEAMKERAALLAELGE